MKKGSKEAKAWGRRMKLLRNGAKPKPKKTTKLKVYNVARRRARKTTKRRCSRARGSSANVGMTIFGGLGYGALREKISNLMAPITAKIPGGVYADNLALGVVSYLAMKKGGKLPMGKYVKKIGEAGLTAESVLAGVDLGSNLFKSNQATSPYFS